MNLTTKSTKRKQRFFHFDDDKQKWGVYELISPYFKDIDGCVKWSNKKR